MGAPGTVGTSETFARRLDGLNGGDRSAPGLPFACLVVLWGFQVWGEEQEFCLPATSSKWYLAERNRDEARR